MPNNKPLDAQTSSQTIIHYKQIAYGAWKDIASQADKGAVAALAGIASELAAAKTLAEINDIVRSLADIGSLDKMTDASIRDSLTSIRSGGRRMVVPGRGGSGQVRYKPDLSLGRGGLASQDSGPVNLGRSTGASGTISRGSDGSVVITRTEKFESGTSVTTVVTYEGGKVTRTDWHIENPDGSTSAGGTVNQDDGGTLEYEINTDADGNVTSENYEHRDSQGNPVKDNDLAGQPGEGQEADSDLARYFRAWHTAVYGPDVIEFNVPVLVNPGTPENADAAHSPSATINPGKGIVINPDPNNPDSPGSGMSAEMASRMQERLKDGGTPGPNPGPQPSGE